MEVTWTECKVKMPHHRPCNYIVWGPGMVRSGEDWLGVDGQWEITKNSGQVITHWMSTVPIPEAETEEDRMRLARKASMSH